jgi:hypothetical protein
MRKPFWFLVGIVTAGVLLGPAAPSAKAIKPFFDEFQAVYLKPESTDKKDQEYVALVQKTKCNVCHQGKSKKERNVYGMALDMLLDRNTDKDNQEKIRQALATVAEIKSDPIKGDSPTFGKLIAEGKLPAGEPKEDKSE